jgi:Flp pilus assembly protein CpaB
VAATPSVLSREAGSPAAASRSVRRRPSASQLLIALAAILAFGLNYLALQSGDATTLVAVADSPIAEGTPFSAQLVRLVPLPSDFEGLGHLIDEQDLTDLAGAVVSRSVAEGELIDRVAVIQPGTHGGLRTMSIPVPVEHAAGGTLVVGDRVDVISMVGEEPAFVATDLEVVGLAETGQTGLAGIGPYHVVVAVSSEEALALARAIGESSIEIVRSTGASPAAEREG